MRGAVDRAFVEEERRYLAAVKLAVLQQQWLVQATEQLDMFEEEELSR